MKINLAIDSGAHAFHVRAFKKAIANNKKSTKAEDNKTSNDAAREMLESKEFIDYLDAFITWCKKYGDALEFYVTLDIVHDEQATWEITKVLSEEGLKPVPVLHYGAEPESILRYRNDYDYIGISIGGGIPPTENYKQWAGKVFKLLGKEHKVHGFASTAYDLLTLPWYSVDSTTPFLSSRAGNILIPSPIMKGSKVQRFDYRKPYTFAVTDGASHRQQHLAQHPRSFQAIVHSYIESIGFTMADISRHYHCRDVANMVFMDRLYRNFPIKYYVSGRTGTQIKNMPWVFEQCAKRGLKELNYLGTFFDLAPFDIVRGVKEGTRKVTKVQESKVREGNTIQQLPFNFEEQRNGNSKDTVSTKAGKWRTAKPGFRTGPDAPVLSGKPTFRFQR